MALRDVLMDAIRGALEPRTEDLIGLDLNQPDQGAVFDELVGQVADAVLDSPPIAVNMAEVAAGARHKAIDDVRWLADSYVQAHTPEGAHIVGLVHQIAMLLDGYDATGWLPEEKWAEWERRRLSSHA